MWTKELQHKNRTEEAVLENSYKGIPIYAAYNLHERCYELFEKYISESEYLSAKQKDDVRVLVLGAGGGAFDQRLIDNGYTNITAIEIYDELYRADNKKIFSKDLNDNFAVGIVSTDARTFDVIIAMEIIEHVENHFHFMRQIKSLLSERGIVLISTPNVESNFSRFKFFLRGDLSYFSDTEIEETGHINPLFTKIFFKYLEVIKMKVMEYSSNTTVYDLESYTDEKQRKNVVVSKLFSLIMRNKNDRQINIFIIKNIL